MTGRPFGIRKGVGKAHRAHPRMLGPPWGGLTPFGTARVLHGSVLDMALGSWQVPYPGRLAIDRKWVWSLVVGSKPQLATEQSTG